MTRKEAVDLAKGAAAFLYEDDPDYVEAGCSDVSEVIAKFLKKHGVAVEVVYGEARLGRSGEPFMHAWLDIVGEQFDPVLWIFRDDLSRYRYKVEPGIKTALYCDFVDSDYHLKELESAYKKGKLKPERPELIEEHQEEEE